MISGDIEITYDTIKLSSLGMATAWCADKVRSGTLAAVAVRGDCDVVIVLDETSFLSVQRNELAVVFGEDQTRPYVRCSHTLYVKIEGVKKLRAKIATMSTITIVVKRSPGLMTYMRNIPVLKRALPLPVGRRRAVGEKVFDRLSWLAADVRRLMDENAMRLLWGKTCLAFAMLLYERSGQIVCIVVPALKGEIVALENKSEPTKGRWYSEDADVVSPVGIARTVKRYLWHFGLKVDAVVAMGGDAHIVNDVKVKNGVVKIRNIPCLQIAKDEKDSSVCDLAQYMLIISKGGHDGAPAIGAVEATAIMNAFVDDIT